MGWMIFLDSVAILFTAAFLQSLLSSRPYRGGQIAMGTVVDTKAVNSSEGTTFAPVVEFADGTGTRYSVVSETSTTWRPSIGRRLRVSYRPGEQNKARVLYGLWMSYLMVAVGVGMTVALIRTTMNMVG